MRRDLGRKFGGTVCYLVTTSMWKARWLWILALAIPLFFAVGETTCTAQSMRACPSNSLDLYESSLSYASVLLSFAGGSFPFDPSSGTAFALPMGWLLVLGLLVAATGSFSFSRNGFAPAAVALSGSERLWFVAGCMSSVLLVVVFFAYALVSSFLVCAAMGADLTAPATGTIPLDSMAAPSSIEDARYSISLGEVVGLFFLNGVWMAVLCVAARAISLVFGEVSALFCVMLLAICSAYWWTPWLLGDWGMAYRSALVVSDGVELANSIVAAIGGCLVLVAVGSVAARRFVVR